MDILLLFNYLIIANAVLLNYQAKNWCTKLSYKVIKILIILPLNYFKKERERNPLNSALSRTYMHGILISASRRFYYNLIIIVNLVLTLIVLCTYLILYIQIKCKVLIFFQCATLIFWNTNKTLTISTNEVWTNHNTQTWLHKFLLK